METLSVTTGSPEQTKALGEAIGRRFSGGEVVLLSGRLGAGKTTLVQGMATGLGVRGRVQSPSFVLERVHRGRLTLRHLDFYRLGARDVEEAGFFAEPDESTVSLVEWAERADSIPEADMRIRISFVPGQPDSRTILIETLSPEWGDKIRDAERDAGLSGD